MWRCASKSSSPPVSSVSPSMFAPNLLPWWPPWASTSSCGSSCSVGFAPGRISSDIRILLVGRVALCARSPTRRTWGQKSSQSLFKSATVVAILPWVGRLSESWRTFAQAFRSPALRRLQLAGAGSALAIWAYSIAIAVYAFREDGATAVGLVLFVRWALAAVFAPWLALFADRSSRRRVMLTVDLTRAALLPTLARTPEELTASNLALNTISSIGMFGGPAIAGVMLAFTGPSAVFALTGVSYLWSAVNVMGLPRDEPPARSEDAAIGAELVGGFRAIGEDRRLQVVVGLVGAQMVVAGALEVVIVVEAIRVLDAGNAAVGWLNTALGVGGLLGGLVGVVLAARRRLAADFCVGLALFGVALALLATSRSLVVALLLFAAMGIGSTLVDVTSMTLLQRSAPSEVVGRVFGVLQSLMLITIATGALVAPLVVNALGPRPTFVAFGVVLPALAVLTWRVLTAIDRDARVPVEPLELLRAIPIFSPL